MRKIAILILGLCACLLTLLIDTPSLASLTPNEIIHKADEVRNPSQSFRMLVEVENFGSQSGVSEFETLIRGNTHTLVKTVQPLRDRGRNLLMKDENMWAFIPNLKRSVRVSLSQKLTGQAANGDISRMRWAGDYEASLERETENEWVLFLKAKKKGLTYDQVRVRIKKKSYHPIEAHYLTINGKPLKRAEFKGYKKIAGKVRPTEIWIIDSVRSDQKSRIKIKTMEVKNYPISLFHQRNLR